MHLKYTRSHTSRIKAGFTLIELLVTISIISSLSVILFVAVAPAKRLNSAVDAKNKVNQDTIYKAISAFLTDNPTGFLNN